LEAFIARFIEPKLPSTERLTAWSTWIIECVKATDVVVVRRHGRLLRGVPYGIQGLRVLPSDLSPVWALQQAILHSDPPTDMPFDEWVSSLPLEHNTVRRRKLDLLNVAGFHAAHLIDVAAHRNASSLVAEADLLRSACLVELHPLNVMWVPKPRWAYWGASVQVKAHYARLSKERVPALWGDFVRSIGAAATLLPEPDPSFRYFYTEDEWRTNTRIYEVLRPTTALRAPQARAIVALLARSGSKRLTEAGIRHLLENGKVSGEFSTTQDVMKVFHYYRKPLKIDGMLKYY
jgi:hypothetical protein